MRSFSLSLDTPTSGRHLYLASRDSFSLNSIRPLTINFTNSGSQFPFSVDKSISSYYTINVTLFIPSSDPDYEFATLQDFLDLQNCGIRDMWFCNINNPNDVWLSEFLNSDISIVPITPIGLESSWYQVQFMLLFKSKL